jgi:hypothetical protein
MFHILSHACCAKAESRSVESRTKHRVIRVYGLRFTFKPVIIFAVAVAKISNTLPSLDSLSGHNYVEYHIDHY